jgi:hypothetical protein
MLCSKKSVKGFCGGKHEGKRPLRRPRHRWEDGIGMNLGKIGRGWVNLIGSEQGSMVGSWG